MHEGGDGQLADQLQRINEPPNDARGYVDWIARESILKAMSRIESHEAECRIYRRSEEQWRQSMTNVLSDMRKSFDEKIEAVCKTFDDHHLADNEFQAKVTNTFSDWNKWTIRGLIGAVIVIGGVAFRLAWTLASIGHGP